MQIFLFNANFSIPNYLYAPRVALFMKTNYPEFKITINSSQVEVINTLDSIDNRPSDRISKSNDFRNLMRLSLDSNNTHKIKLYKKNNIVDIVNTDLTDMKCNILDFVSSEENIPESNQETVTEPYENLKENFADAFEQKSGDTKKVVKIGAEGHSCFIEEAVKDLKDDDNTINLYLPTSVLKMMTYYLSYLKEEKENTRMQLK